MCWFSLNAIVSVIVPDFHKEMHIRLCVYMVLMFPDLMLSSLRGSRRSSRWTESCPMTSWEDKSLTVWPNTSSSVRNVQHCTLCPPCFWIFILTVTVRALFTSPHQSSRSKKWTMTTWQSIRFFLLQGNTTQTGSPQLFRLYSSLVGATCFSLVANHKASGWMACCFQPVGRGGG